MSILVASAALRHGVNLYSSRALSASTSRNGAAAFQGPAPRELFGRPAVEDAKTQAAAEDMAAAKTAAAVAIEAKLAAEAKAAEEAAAEAKAAEEAAAEAKAAEEAAAEAKAAEEAAAEAKAAEEAAVEVAAEAATAMVALEAKLVSEAAAAAAVAEAAAAAKGPVGAAARVPAKAFLLSPMSNAFDARLNLDKALQLLRPLAKLDNALGGTKAGAVPPSLRADPSLPPISTLRRQAPQSVSSSSPRLSDSVRPRERPRDVLRAARSEVAMSAQ